MTYAATAYAFICVYHQYYTDIQYCIIQSSIYIFIGPTAGLFFESLWLRRGLPKFLMKYAEEVVLCALLLKVCESDIKNNTV